VQTILVDNPGHPAGNLLEAIESLFQRLFRLLVRADFRLELPVKAWSLSVMALMDRASSANSSEPPHLIR